MKRLLYAVSLLTAVFALTSCPPEPPEPKPEQRSIALDAINVEQASAAIRITPTDTEATWYSLSCTKSAFDKNYGNLSDYQLIASDYEYMKEQVDLYIEYGYEISLADLLYTDEHEVEISKLTPNTEYIVWAAYLDLEGKNDSIAFKTTYTTLAAEGNAEFTFDETDDAVTINCSSSDYYFVMFCPKEQVPESGMESYYRQAVQLYASQQILDLYWQTGSTEYKFGAQAYVWGLPAGTHTMSMAVAAIDGAGNIISDVIVREYTFEYDGNWQM